MKKIILLLFVTMAGMTSCLHNFDIEHPDYKYSTVYFGYQFPVRTLILGDYIYDNSNDNAGKFVISAHLGGLLSNKADKKFTVALDKSLCDNLVFFGTTETILPMPDNYYKLLSTELIIPKDMMSGGVTVQLTDAFFADPLAIKNKYVVPLRLMNNFNAVDSLLVGSKYADNPNPDPRFVSQWFIPPKDFTMFVVKYVNEYHGTYFQWGTSKTSGSNVASSDSTYKNRWVEYNPALTLSTTGRNRVEGSFILKSKAITGTVKMIMDFSGAYNGANSCTISGSGTMGNYTYTITGSGKFANFEAGSYNGFGDKNRNGITLNYTINAVDKDGKTITYSAQDELVLRSRDIVMEIYTPALK